jgi:hypothetical protein
VTATGFHLIGKETERGWEQADDISTLLPSLLRYHNRGVIGEQMRQRLQQIPLAFLERETGLSRHTILRARRGQPVHPRSLRLLTTAVRKIPIQQLSQLRYRRLRGEHSQKSESPLKEISGDISNVG